MKFHKKVILAISLLAVGAIAYATLQAGGRANASATARSAALGQSSPTGQELSPATAAEDAIADAREGIAPGNLTLRVTHSTVGQVRSLLDAEDGSSKPTSSGKASCFPGLPCTTQEVEQHEAQQRKLEANSAYLVEMTGTSFSPPSIRLRRGRSAPSGEVEAVVINADTGFPLERIITDTHIDIESLGSVTEMTATVPSELSTETIAVISRRSTSATLGKIVGQVKGSGKTHASVTVSEGLSGNRRGTRVVRRTTTSSRGTFAAAELLPGRYSVGVAAQGLQCAGKTATVRAGKTTRITVTCKHG